MKILNTLFLFLLLSGCSSAPTKSTYIQDNSTEAAKVQGTWSKESMTFWEGYSIISVDDKFLSNSLFGNTNAAIVKIKPGQRKLVAHVKFSRGIRPGPFEAYVPLHANLEASQLYKLNGNIKGDKVNVWLEHIPSKKRITNVASSGYRQQSGDMVIPIIIPK